MGKTAMTHRGRSTVLPPIDLLEPFIERTPFHWYWLDSFYDDNLDKSASFRWAPPAENAVLFMVPRLLWQLTNPTKSIKRMRLENTCGLFTCINPDHWKRGDVVKDPGATFTLPKDHEARLVAAVSHGWSEPVVHVAHADAIRTVCGIKRTLNEASPGTVITCPSCLREWRALGRPLVEVKP